MRNEANTRNEHFAAFIRKRTLPHDCEIYALFVAKFTRFKTRLFLKELFLLNEIKNVPFPTVVSASLSKILCEIRVLQHTSRLKKNNNNIMALNIIIIINKRLQILS